jgi:hypothetical protein
LLELLLLFGGKDLGKLRVDVDLQFGDGFALFRRCVELFDEELGEHQARPAHRSAPSSEFSRSTGSSRATGTALARSRSTFALRGFAADKLSDLLLGDDFVVIRIGAFEKGL